MATVRIPLGLTEDLDALYERARKLEDGFAERFKVTMARLPKKAMTPDTIERLLDGIEAVLSVNGMAETERLTLDTVRAQMRAELERHRGESAMLASAAITAARASLDRLIASGLPPSALPALGSLDRFVVSAGAVIAAIREYIGSRCAEDRADHWAARAVQLAAGSDEILPVEEAARLVEFMCRWAAACFAADEASGITTLSGPLVDPRARGLLATAHLECAIVLDRGVYRPPELAGNLSSACDWLTRYPSAYHIVVTRSLERVLGYLVALPMALDDILDVVRSGNDARVPSDRIAACTPGQRVYVYIPSVVVRCDCAQRLLVKNELRQSFLKGLQQLRARGVEIEALVAVGYTDSGRKLLHTHGFEPAVELEARLGCRSVLLGDPSRLYHLTRTGTPHGVLAADLHAAAFAARP